jgi:gluconolactonase
MGLGEVRLLSLANGSIHHHRRLMTPLLTLLLIAAQDAEAPTLQDLMAPEAAVEKLAGEMGFIEGPVWLPKEKKLVFSDIPGAKLMQWSKKGGLKLFRKSPNPNGNLLDREGRLLTCRHGARDIVRTEKDGKLTVLCDSFEDKRLNSPNDVAVKSDGTLWFTDPPWGLPGGREGKEQPGHWVYRFDPKTKEVTVLVKDLCMPNGIAFSVDEKHIYIADTGGHGSHPDEALHKLPATVTAYEVKADGSLNPKPVWKTVTLCDGMCVDVLGNIYTTARSGVTVLSPKGKILGTIKTPESPANCCFGGDDFKTLYITARSSLYSVELANPGVKLRKG